MSSHKQNLVIYDSHFSSSIACVDWQGQSKRLVGRFWWNTKHVLSVFALCHSFGLRKANTSRSLAQYIVLCFCVYLLLMLYWLHMNFSPSVSILIHVHYHAIATNIIIIIHPQTTTTILSHILTVCLSGMPIWQSLQHVGRMKHCYAHTAVSAV